MPPTRSPRSAPDGPRDDRTALRTVVVGSGSPLFHAAARAVAGASRTVAVVLPASPRGVLRRLRQRLRNTATARSLGARLVLWSEDVAGRLEALSPDLISVASFPHILPPRMLTLARHGVHNLHLSLLPRHRGPDPLFWTYWMNDAKTGATVHRMEASIDAGPIVLQRETPLERGRAFLDLYRDLAAMGAALAAQAVRAVAAGEDVATPQDEVGASYESRRDRIGLHLPSARWPSERVWHVLSGLGGHHHDLLRDTAGETIPHGRPLGPPVAGGVGDGRVEIGDRSCRIHCYDGVVEVALQGPRRR